MWFGLTIDLNEIWINLSLALLIFVAYVSIRFGITYWYLKVKRLSMPGLISTSLLSVDIESLVVLMIAVQIGIFASVGADTPIALFAPSVLLSTLIVVVLVAVFSKIEKPSRITLKR